MKQKLVKWILGICIIMAIFHSFITNEKPLVALSDGKKIYPIIEDFICDVTFKERTKFKYNETDYKPLAMPIIPYGHQTIGKMDEANLPPFTANHLLGTDKLGRDVFASVLRGLYNAFRIGLLSVLIASILGMCLGLIMGYFGDDGIKINLLQLIFWIVIFFLILFYLAYGFHDVVYINVCAWFLFSFIVFFLNKKLGELPIKKSIAFPLDTLLMKIVELRKAMPMIVLILALLPIFKSASAMNVVLIISLLTWPIFTRHSRAETKSVLEKDFVLSAKSIGITFMPLMVRYIVPNLLPTLRIVFIFSLVSNILTESTLSFLGLGLPINEVSWGSMLNEGRKNLSAWWLTVFPGLALFLVVYTLNLMSEEHQ